MPKRKSTHSAGVEDAPPRRSTRQRTSTSTSTSISKSAATSTTSTPIPKVKAKSPRAKLESSKPTKTTPTTAAQATGAKGKPAQTEEAASPAPAADDSKPQTNGTGRSNPRGTQAPGAAAAAAPREGTNTAGRQYWLMKAEPETRYENGVDVSFSIDDLAAKTEPEPWDGIRNYVARNNLRAMKKGGLAFFWHSNCKEPGIVGTMEIVQEHTPDLSAHDAKSAYYDPKSSPSDPKWSVVHVKFRNKFAVPIKLKEMREMAVPGKPLENMQMMKQSRLSVSRVSEAEWNFLMGVIEEKTNAAA